MSVNMLNVSILILTKNEEQDLPGCLESVCWSTDIVVLDSESTDRTRDIAATAGATVLTKPFEGYAKQRNFGLAHSFKNDWVLILDADERVSDELRVFIQKFVVTASPSVAAARMRRRDIWWGTWLKHAQISPFFVRLVRPARVHYEREINEVLVVEGETIDIQGDLDHFPFSKGLAHWIDKHNRYARMEAQVIVEKLSVKPRWDLALRGRDFNERRTHQKAIFYRLPFRPFIKFLYMMCIRLAFLDGVAGIRYAFLQSIYEYFIVLYTVELRGFRVGGDQSIDIFSTIFIEPVFFL